MAMTIPLDNTKGEPMIRLDNLEVGPQLCRITVEKAKTARVFYSLNGGGQLKLAKWDEISSEGAFPNLIFVG
jgi:hypothetical protein